MPKLHKRCDTRLEVPSQQPTVDQGGQGFHPPSLSTPPRKNLRQSSAECTTFPSEIPTARLGENLQAGCLPNYFRRWTSTAGRNMDVPRAATTELCFVTKGVGLLLNWSTLQCRRIPEGRHALQLKAAQVVHDFLHLRQYRIMKLLHSIGKEYDNGNCD